MILAGLGLYLATCLITRHALTWAWALVPGLGLALAIEAWEVWDHYRLAGLVKAEARDLLAIALRHGQDVLIVNLAPIAVFLAAQAVERLTRA